MHTSAAPSIAIEQGLPLAETCAVLERLPDWFGRPESLLAYAQEAEQLACVAARRDGTLVGLVSLKPATRAACELAVMGVSPELHRQGLGRAMVERACAWMCENGFSLALVTTFGPSIANRFYARTHAFYEAVGFLPLIELKDYPDADTPTLYLVRPLMPAGASRRP